MGKDTMGWEDPYAEMWVEITERELVWGHRMKRAPIKNERLPMSTREQSITDFKLRGPCPDELTQFERDFPEKAGDCYNPWSEEWDVVINGPRLHEIPRSIVEALALRFGCPDAPWVEGPWARPSATVKSDQPPAGKTPPVEMKDSPPPPAVLPILPPKTPVRKSVKKTTTPSPRPARRREKKVKLVVPLEDKTRTEDLRTGSEFAALISGNGELARRVNDLAFGLLTPEGQYLGDRLVERFGNDLARGVTSPRDLKSLSRVLEDAERIARACKTPGSNVDTDILLRFARVNANFQAEIRKFFAGTRKLLAIFSHDRSLGLRLLCLDDEQVRSAVHTHRKKIDPLIATPTDAKAFLELLIGASRNNDVNPDTLIAALPRIKADLTPKNAREAFLFVSKILSQGAYLHSAGDESWHRNLREKFRALQAQTRETTEIFAILHPYEDMIEISAPWVASKPDAERIARALEKIHRQSYGSSDADPPLRGMIPEVFRKVTPLIGSLEDFLLFSEVVPAILRSLPADGETTFVGHTYWYDLSDFAKMAKTARSIRDLISRFTPPPPEDKGC